VWRCFETCEEETRSLIAQDRHKDRRPAQGNSGLCDSFLRQTYAFIHRLFCSDCSEQNCYLKILLHCQLPLSQNITTFSNHYQRFCTGLYRICIWIVVELSIMVWIFVFKLELCRCHILRGPPFLPKFLEFATRRQLQVARQKWWICKINMVNMTEVSTWFIFLKSVE